MTNKETVTFTSLSVIPTPFSVIPAKAGIQVKFRKAFTWILRSSRRMTNKETVIPVKTGIQTKFQKAFTWILGSSPRMTGSVTKVKAQRAFTLVELLITIAILAVLASAVIVVLNPQELLAQSRDVTRVQDIQSLNKDLSLYLQFKEALPSTLQPNKVYISIPYGTPDCGYSPTTNPLNLPSLPSGYTYNCATQTDYKSSVNGWLPIDFTQSPNISLPALPSDPVNQSSNYYAFVYGNPNQWALSALLDSQKYLKSTSSNDGGTDPGRFETGNNLSLMTQASGLVGYWPMDEGSGTTTADLSGNGNTGTLFSNPVWTNGCKVGKCLTFDGQTNFVQMSPLNNFPTAKVTVSTWVNLTGNINWNDFIQNSWGANGGWLLYSDISAATIFGVFSGGNQYNAYCTNYSGFILNKWNNIVGTYDGANVNLYLNGNLCATVGAPVQTLITSGIQIGNRDVGGPSHQMDDARVYNRSLSASEIKAIYAAQK